MLDLKVSTDLCEILDHSSPKKNLHSSSAHGLHFSS